MRAAQYLVLGAKARALTSGRYHVSFDDIRAMAHPVLRHRVLTNFRAESEGVTHRLDHRRVAVGRGDAEIGDVRRLPQRPQACREHSLRAWSSAVRTDAAATRSMPGARFVDPTILARIGNLELLARTVVDGFINGLHRAPYFGASIDFAEHRGYVAGDDIRRVDWRLFARTDRFYVKQYEADTNTNFCVLFDVSKSMGFKSRDGLEAGIRAAILARVPRLPRAPAARPRRHHHLRQRHRHARAAVGEALRRAAAHARSREGRAAGQAGRADQQDRRALPAAQRASC